MAKVVKAAPFVELERRSSGFLSDLDHDLAVEYRMNLYSPLQPHLAAKPLGPRCHSSPAGGGARE